MVEPYFGAFGHALTYAIANLGFRTSETEQDHAKLVALFKRGKFMGVGSRLQELRIRRNVADYEANPNVQWSLDAKSSIEKAAWIVRQLT